MTEHDNLHFRLKKYLRNNNITDHSKFRIIYNKNRDRQEISKWEYSIPMPAASDIPPTLEPFDLFTEKEDEEIHKCDIYTGTSTVGQTEAALPVMQLRKTHVSTAVSGGSMLLEPGYYKFTVYGKRFTNVPFSIFLSTILNEQTTHFIQFGVRSEYFNFSCFNTFGVPCQIAVSTQRQSTGDNPRTNITLLVERI